MTSLMDNIMVHLFTLRPNDVIELTHGKRAPLTEINKNYYHLAGHYL